MWLDELAAQPPAADEGQETKPPERAGREHGVELTSPRWPGRATPCHGGAPLGGRSAAARASGGGAPPPLGRGRTAVLRGGTTARLGHRGAAPRLALPALSARPIGLDEEQRARQHAPEENGQ